MNSFNKVAVFASSVLLLFSVFVVSGGTLLHPVDGKGVTSTITLDVSNAAVISSGVPGSGTLGYKNSVTMHYDSVQDTEGYHTTIMSGGSIYNDASTIITSITSVLAKFSGPGSLILGANFHRETTLPDITLTSETPVSFTDYYDYFEVKAQYGDVLLSSLIISYSCTPQTPALNYYSHGSYYEFGWVTRDPYSVEVPATFNGLPVTGLAPNAFAWSPSLQTVILDSGIVSLGNSSFFDCPNLSSVLLPDTLGYIGQDAFHNTPLLTDINFPLTLTTIDDSGFKNSGLTHVRLPDGFTNLMGYSFQYCASLVDIVIPTSLTLIGDWSFYSCSALNSVFYRGDATQWAAIDFGSGNGSLAYASVYYYSETDPSASGYWHYLDGVPVIWPFII